MRGEGGAKAKRAMPKCPPREFEWGFPKVGMVWYEFNIVNQRMNLQGRYRAARAAKKKMTNVRGT